MAETKLTAKQLKAQIAALLNKKAKETDEIEKAKLKREIDSLNEQLKAINKESSLEENLSVVEKAKKELERLNKLDPGTPGVAPAKAAQEKIIADATKKGLPKPTPKPEPTPKPTPGPTEEPVVTPKPTVTTKPGVKPSAVVPEGFNVGTFRAADEASMAKAGGTVTGTKTATGNEDINAIYTLAKSKYGNVDSIFLYDPELKKILIDAVGDPATAKDDMDETEFLRRLNASDWAIRNASTYRARDAQRREYTETLDKYNQQLAMADTQDKKDAILSKIGQLNTTSGYARGLASAKAFIEATASGLTGTMDPTRLDAFVKRMYDSANDKDANIINRELAALVSYKPGSQLGGTVGADLTKLRATARANGFDLDTTFKDQINGWLQRIAVGESVETFQNTIRSQAKLGLPDKVANLLDQGLDLSNIYAPYKNLMAAVLEVAPDSINLNDGTLRSAIGPEKEMSLYDFQRVLRKDPRWQYTDNARTEASDSVLKVLKDFGFQG
jgi:outer membrane biosynthesis protein TonB